MIFILKDTQRTSDMRSITPLKVSLPKLDEEKLLRKNKRIIREANQVQRKIDLLHRQTKSSQSKIRSKSTLDGRFTQTFEFDKKDKDWVAIKRDNYLEKFNPLSVKPRKGGRDSNFLEEVIQMRKGKIIEV